MTVLLDASEFDDDGTGALGLAAKRLSRGTEPPTFGLRRGGARFAVLGSIIRASVDGGGGVVGFENKGKGIGVATREPGTAALGRD